MNAFHQKKILFFSPKFFGYGQEIAAKLTELGSTVHYFDEKPANDFMTKALVRINKKILSKKIGTYYDSIFASIEKDFYDVVFFLTPESISKSSLEQLKRAQSNATFILYMWDSLKNRRNVYDLLPFFHRTFSFDKNDCDNPNYNFQFRPLFYLDEYKDRANDKAKLANDLLFIGTVHSDRYKLLTDIKKECERLHIELSAYMFLQSKIMYYYNKCTDTFFRKSSIKDFEFNALSKEEIMQKVIASKAILDIHHPAQSGLTMRAIEMLGAKKKVITTNKEVLNYDFYRESNIYYLDRDNPKLSKSFFESGYEDLDEQTYFKYAIEGWLTEVFSNTPS